MIAICNKINKKLLYKELRLYEGILYHVWTQNINKTHCSWVKTVLLRLFVEFCRHVWEHHNRSCAGGSGFDPGQLQIFLSCEPLSPVSLLVQLHSLVEPLTFRACETGVNFNSWKISILNTAIPSRLCP